MGSTRITSHGIAATITIISVAKLSPRLEPESRRAPQIGVRPLGLFDWRSIRKLISTAIFSVSFARIFRVAVSLSSSDCTSLNFSWISTRSFTLSDGFAVAVRRQILQFGFGVHDRRSFVFAFRGVLNHVALLFCLREQLCKILWSDTHHDASRGGEVARPRGQARSSDLTLDACAETDDG